MDDRKRVIQELNDLHVVACGLDGTQCYVNGIGIKQLRELIGDATKLLRQPITIGRWVQLHGDFTTPGGTPCYVCGRCGGSGHLFGAEYRKRKVLCDGCGNVNIYPWERAYEEGTALWEEPRGGRE